MNTIKANFAFSIILLVIFLVNYFFILNPFQSELLENNLLIEKKLDFNELINYRLVMFNSICFTIIILLHTYFKIKNENLLIAYIMLFSTYTFSIILNNLIGQNDEMGLALLSTPVSYLALLVFSIRYEVDKRIYGIMAFLLIYWSIMPMISIIINPAEYYKYFSYYGDGITSTFRGYALNRNEYSFYAGLSIIVLFLSRINKIMKILFILAIIASILLAESRTTIIALVICYLYIKHEKNKFTILMISKYLLGISFLYGVMTLYQNYSVRGIEQLTNYSDRKEIIYIYIDSIQNNLFWGVGKNFIDYNGDVAHNFIIQIIASYGIFVFASFIFFIYTLWKKTNKNFRTILLYLMFFGLFQPYFSLASINNMTLIAVIFAISLNVPTAMQNSISSEFKK